MWYDEAHTVHFSSSTFKEALAQTQSWGSYPIIYPSGLYLVQKVSQGPVAVRLPSVLASIAAILVMLAMVRVNVGHDVAILAAAILTVSFSQIRYAQEVREYSLSVLFAAILVFCYLQYINGGFRRGHPMLLYAVLFVVPFIQYGLVLLALGTLSALGMLHLSGRNNCITWSRSAIAFVFLGSGGLLSFFLTLRHQLGIRQSQSYLAGNYFDPKTMNIPSFLSANSYQLLSFLVPGRAIVLCFAVAVTFFCIGEARRREFSAVTILAFTSILITMVAALARAYPYGGIRQCLFLAPVLALFAAIAFADLLAGLGRFYSQVGVGGLLILIVISGGRQIIKSSPYQEVEDIRSVLGELAKFSTPNDQVYVYSGAEPAVDFYLHRKDSRFVYGKYHREDPQKYGPELLALIDSDTNRTWLVFSHIYGSEEQVIVDSLRSGWMCGMWLQLLELLFT